MSADWWDELDDSILHCLREGGAMSPADLGRRLGISPREATACVAMLATQGKIRLRLVELSDQDAAPAPRRPRRAQVPAGR